MELMYTGLLLLLFCSAHHFSSAAGDGLLVQDPEVEWEKMASVIGEEMMHSLAPVAKSQRAPAGRSLTWARKRVPEYVIVSASQDQKLAFVPETGARPLPAGVKNMLLHNSLTTPVTGQTPGRQKFIEILCPIDRVYARISRRVFRAWDAYKYLYLGTCPVNYATRTHYYFLYLLQTDCGFQKQVGK